MPRKIDELISWPWLLLFPLRFLCIRRQKYRFVGRKSKPNVRTFYLFKNGKWKLVHSTLPPWWSCCITNIKNVLINFFYVLLCLNALPSQGNLCNAHFLTQQLGPHYQAVKNEWIVSHPSVRIHILISYLNNLWSNMRWGQSASEQDVIEELRFNVLQLRNRIWRPKV